MAQADGAIANVATPSIHADLGASGAALELVIGGYLIAYAVLLITGARLGQTHGYRRVFLLGVAVFTAASLVCGLAPSPLVLIAARIAQGVGAALMFPQALTGIQLNFTGPARPGPARRVPEPSASTPSHCPPAPSPGSCSGVCSSRPTWAAPGGGRFS